MLMLISNNIEAAEECFYHSPQVLHKQEAKTLELRCMSLAPLEAQGRMVGAG
jgi:hypothetical protein